MGQQPMTRIGMIRIALLVLVVCGVGTWLSGCTQESQNRLNRSIQNWTGTDGVLDIYAGEKLVLRFIQIDKISTASATADGGRVRPYRFGYGHVDTNLDFRVDEGGKKVYFEFSDYWTSYFFMRTI